MHNLENEAGVFEKAQNTVLAKQIDISLTFMPIHEQSPSAEGSTFPYNVQLQSDVKIDEGYGTSTAETESTAAEANDQAAAQGVLNNVK